MKKSFFILLFLSLTCIISSTSHPLSLSSKTSVAPIKKEKYSYVSENKYLFDNIHLEGILRFEAFEAAMNGYNQLKSNLKNSNILTVIDFTLPSTEKRMYVIDLEKKELLFHTIVSHGRNTGELYATKFSNRHNSHQSSLGFYETEGTYQGSNGYSLRINGLEKNINDQAKARAVVIHGADYCSQSVINKTGRLGRSYGCPALPRELNAPIINTIKNGSLLFIYSEDKSYLASSKLVKNEERVMLAEHIDDSELEDISRN